MKEDDLSLENIIKRHKKWHREWVKENPIDYDCWRYEDIERNKKRIKELSKGRIRK